MRLINVEVFRETNRKGAIRLCGLDDVVPPWALPPRNVKPSTPNLDLYDDGGTHEHGASQLAITTKVPYGIRTLVPSSLLYL